MNLIRGSGTSKSRSIWQYDIHSPTLSSGIYNNYQTKSASFYIVGKSLFSHGYRNPFAILFSLSYHQCSPFNQKRKLSQPSSNIIWPFLKRTSKRWISHKKIGNTESDKDTNHSRVAEWQLRGLCGAVAAPAAAAVPWPSRLPTHTTLRSLVAGPGAEPAGPGPEL